MLHTSEDSADFSSNYLLGPSMVRPECLALPSRTPLGCPPPRPQVYASNLDRSTWKGVHGLEAYQLNAYLNQVHCLYCIGMEVVIKIFKGEVEIASESVASPVTAAEAKIAICDIKAAWVGKLTKPGSSVALVGQSR